MTKTYRQVPMDAEVHERLTAARARASELVLYKREVIGVGSMVGILLAHFAEHPPETGWLQDQVNSAPKRGRPRRSMPMVRTDEWGKETVVPAPRSGVGRSRPHKWIASKAFPDVKVCLLCSQPERAEFLDQCDWRGALGQQRSPLSARLARAAGFTDAEIREHGIALD